MNIGKTNFGIKGRQNLQVLVKGKVVRETGFQHNLVLDSIFSKIVTIPSGMDNREAQAVSVGTGTTAPSPTQTNLANFLTTKHGADSIVHTVLASTPGFLNYRTSRIWTFTESAVQGNISEVMTYIGQGTNPTASTVGHTRALVLDTGGQPTTISVGMGEQLRIIHELELAVSTTVLSQTFDVITAGSTVTYTVETAPINKTSNFLSVLFFSSGVQVNYRPVTAWENFNFGVDNGAPVTSGNNSTLSTPIPTFTLVTPTKIRVTSVQSSTQANIAAGIGGFTAINNCFGFKITPNLPKNNLNKWTIGYDIEFTRL